MEVGGGLLRPLCKRTPGRHLHQAHRHHSNGLRIRVRHPSAPSATPARAKRVPAKAPSFVMFDLLSSVRFMAFGASLADGLAELGSLPGSCLPDLAISRCWRTYSSHTRRRPMVLTPSAIVLLQLPLPRLHCRSTRAMIRCRRPRKTPPTTSLRPCVLRKHTSCLGPTTKSLP